MFFFSKTHSVFELQRSYLNLAKVDTLPSLTSNVGVTALLLRESLKKTSIECFYLHFGKFNLSTKFYLYFITTGENRLQVCHSFGIQHMNLFLVYPWPYIKHANF